MCISPAAAWEGPPGHGKEVEGGRAPRREGREVRNEPGTKLTKLAEWAGWSPTEQRACDGPFGEAGGSQPRRGQERRGAGTRMDCCLQEGHDV